MSRRPKVADLQADIRRLRAYEEFHTVHATDAWGAPVKLTVRDDRGGRVAVKMYGIRRMSGGISEICGCLVWTTELVADLAASEYAWERDLAARMNAEIRQALGVAS